MKAKYLKWVETFGVWDWSPYHFFSRPPFDNYVPARPDTCPVPEEPEEAEDEIIDPEPGVIEGTDNECLCPGDPGYEEANTEEGE